MNVANQRGNMSVENQRRLMNVLNQRRPHIETPLAIATTGVAAVVGAATCGVTAAVLNYVGADKYSMAALNAAKIGFIGHGLYTGILISRLNPLSAEQVKDVSELLDQITKTPILLALLGSSISCLGNLVTGSKESYLACALIGAIGSTATGVV